MMITFWSFKKGKWTLEDARGTLSPRSERAGITLPESLEGFRWQAQKSP